MSSRTVTMYLWTVTCNWLLQSLLKHFFRNSLISAVNRCLNTIDPVHCMVGDISCSTRIITSVIINQLKYSAVLNKEKHYTRPSISEQTNDRSKTALTRIFSTTFMRIFSSVQKDHLKIYMA